MNERPMSPLQRYTSRVLHRWRVIAAVTVVGVLLSVVWAVVTSTTSWTATAALTTQSQSRAPEQDAVLALGYVDYFNQDTYQDLLRSEAAIPNGVKLSAKTGATSPILYIEAEGTSEDQVRTAAAVASERFRNDVRDSLVEERTRSAGDLQTQIDKYVDSLQQPRRTQAEANVILDQIRSLQGRLTDIQSDNTNLLKPLQPTPGVASASPSKATDIAAGTVGGLVLGVLIALLLVVLDNRLRTAGDVRDRLGLDTVAEFDRRTTPADRMRRIENLANRLSLGSTGGPVVVAVVAPHSSLSASAFAHDLATSCASRRTGSMLVKADLHGDGDATVGGLADVIDRRMSIGAAAYTGANGLVVLPPGRSAGRDPFAVFDPDRFGAVIEEASKHHDFVVIEAPGVLDASESQVICDIADHVLVVVDRDATRWTEAREAVELLAKVRAPVSGVVLEVPRPVQPVEPDVDTTLLTTVDAASAEKRETDVPSTPGEAANRATTNGAKVNGAGTNGTKVNGTATNGANPVGPDAPVGNPEGKEADVRSQTTAARRPSPGRRTQPVSVGPGAASTSTSTDEPWRT